MYGTYKYQIQGFQSTLPRGSDIISASMSAGMKDFNPRYREVATPLPEWEEETPKISIHATAR